MPFDENGFLGNQISHISYDIVEEFREIFQLCYDLNSFAQAVKFEFEVNNQDVQQIVSSCLFIKILNGFQATVILSRLGLATEAKIITRSILETLFILKAICENKEAAIDYLKTHKVKQKKILNTILNKDTLIGLKEHVDNDTIDRIRKQNEEEGVREIKVQDWARRAMLEIEYETAYRVLSDDVHSTPAALEKYVQTDDNMNVISLECSPQTHDLRPTLSTACQVLLISLDVLCNLFNIDKTDDLKAFEAKINCIDLSEDLKLKE